MVGTVSRAPFQADAIVGGVQGAPEPEAPSTDRADAASTSSELDAVRDQNERLSGRVMQLEEELEGTSAALAALRRARNEEDLPKQSATVSRDMSVVDVSASVSVKPTARAEAENEAGAGQEPAAQPDTESPLLKELAAAQQAAADANESKSAAETAAADAEDRVAQAEQQLKDLRLAADLAK